MPVTIVTSGTLDDEEEGEPISGINVTATIAEKSLLFATGTAASSGDNTLIAAPGGGAQIRILALQIQNESATPTTLILKFGAVSKWRTLAQLQGDGLSIPLPAGRGWPVGVGNALVLNLSGANSCGYSICYSVEAV
jgi:hypothetical protein